MYHLCKMANTVVFNIIVDISASFGGLYRQQLCYSHFTLKVCFTFSSYNFILCVNIPVTFIYTKLVLYSGL